MTRGFTCSILIWSVACAQELPGLDDGSSTSVTETTSALEGAETSAGPGGTTIDLDTTATEGDTSMTTGVPLDCITEDGTYDPACDADAPFCVGGQCTGCNEEDPLTSCATAPARGAPGTVCNAGACVQCNDVDATACVGTTPICDPGTSSCTACTAHDQCPGDAGCHLFEGSCLPSDAVLIVDGADPACSTAGPVYCDISSALDAAGVGSSATIRVASGVYVESVAISPNAVVAVIATGVVTIAANNGSATVTINATGTGYLQGTVIENLAVAPGVQSSGDLRLDDATIQASDVGLLSSSGLVFLEDVRISNNALTGVSVSGTDQVTLRNVIIAGNNGMTVPRGFVTTAATPFDMVYTTIADNAGLNGGAINCVGGEATRSVRNSILLSRTFSNAINCGESLTVTHSVITDTDYEGEETNVPVLDDSTLSFGAGYEIQLGSVAEDVALWSTGDPLLDINGVMRPAVDGSPDAAGANLPN